MTKSCLLFLVPAVVGLFGCWIPSGHAFGLVLGKKYSTTTTTTSSLYRQPSKWDLLDDTDAYGDAGDDDDAEDGLFEYTPAPPDMTYEPRNVKRAHETFLAIRGAAGKAMTTDVYVQVPNNPEVFWYTGKVVRVSDVSLEQCIARQWSMIERHAANMRPIDVYPQRGRVVIWTAPGDSELEVAYNRPSLQMQKMSKTVDGAGAKEVKATMVGFQGEVYQKGEEGFRTWRTEDGLPARPEINAGGESRPPTEEELLQIQKEMHNAGGESRPPTEEERLQIQEEMQGENIDAIDAEQE
jgi:hypothetical protein